MGKITFQNLPNTTTPINATNLNTIQDISITGSDSNGYYVKYDDGTLIQWGVIPQASFLQPNDIYTTVQGIKLYRSEPGRVTLPISFKDTNYTISALARTGSSASGREAMVRLHSKVASNFQIQLISLDDYTSSGAGYTNLVNVEWMAIGRWK